MIENGLAYLPQQYPTIEEMNTLPQQIMTSDQIWDPSVFDTKMPLEEFIKSFPISTEKEKDFYDEEGNLILNVSATARNHLISAEPSSTGSENEFFTLENSTSKEILCTFKDDTTAPSSPMLFSIHNTSFIYN